MDANITKRLYKSRTDRMIDGVCGGIAEYIGLDSTLVRIAWVLLTFLGGSGIVLYILAMIIMPSHPGPRPAEVKQQSSAGSQKFWGLLLVTVGLVWLLSNMGLSFWHHWWGISWEIVLAVLLILAGVGFLFGGRNYISANSQASPVAEAEPDTGTETPRPAEPTRRLYKSRIERKLFGVCGGLGEYFNLDPTIVRLLFVLSAIASFGIALFAYIVMAIVVPEKPITVQL